MGFVGCCVFQGFGWVWGFGEEEKRREDRRGVVGARLVDAMLFDMLVKVVYVLNFVLIRERSFFEGGG